MENAMNKTLYRLTHAELGAVIGGLELLRDQFAARDRLGAMLFIDALLQELGAEASRRDRAGREAA